MSDFFNFLLRLLRDKVFLVIFAAILITLKILDYGNFHLQRRNGASRKGAA